MLHFNKMAAVLISLGALAVGGCGDSSDDASINVETAKAGAAASLAKAINTATTSISTVSSNSTATNVVIGKKVMNLPLSAQTQTDVLNQLKQVFASFPLARVTAARTLNPAALPTTMGEVTEEDLKQYFGTATQVGNTISYTLNADVLCADIIDLYTDINEEMECRNIAAQITLVQTVVDADTGTLTLKVGTAAPLVIGYDTHSIYLQIDVAEIKAAAIVLGATNMDLPATMVGTVRLTVTVLNATPDAESAEITLGTPTAIDIVGTSVNLQIAATDKLLEIAADAGAQTATVSLGFGLVHFKSTENFGTLFHLGGLTGTLVLDNVAKTLAGTNIGIIGDLQTDDNTTDTSIGIEVTLAPFDFMVDGTTDIIKFTKALDFQVTKDNVGTINDGVFSAAVEPGTEVQSIGPSASTKKVIAGGVNITGTGIFADGGPINATPMSNSCFAEDSTTDFGFRVVSCPSTL